MTIREATACDSFSTVARTVRRVCGLPAVPTLDWCDRAAAAVTSLVDRSVCRVWLITATWDGRIIDADEPGAADSRPGDTRGPARIRGGHLGARSALGWWIPPGPDPQRERAAVFDQNVEVAHGVAELERWWQGQRVPVRLVGITPVPPLALGRFLGVELGYDHGPAEDDQRLAGALAAVLHELSLRARVAFGSEHVVPANRITDRELEVLDMLALGHSVKDIADAMDRSPHTVHDHVKSLHRKLRVSSRGELIGRMLGHGGAEARHPAPTA